MVYTRAQIANMAEQLPALVQGILDQLQLNQVAQVQLTNAIGDINTQPEAPHRVLGILLRHVDLKPYSSALVDGDFTEWLEKFDQVCTAENIAPDDRVRMLPVLLRENAEERFRSLPEATRADYQATCEALKASLQFPNLDRYYQLRLYKREMQPNETVEHYYADLVRMGRIAWPHKSAEQREADLLPIFENGLQPEEL